MTLGIMREVDKGGGGEHSRTPGFLTFFYRARCVQMIDETWLFLPFAIDASHGLDVFARILDKRSEDMSTLESSHESTTTWPAQDLSAYPVRI
jgi:hypothetical protein